MAIVQISRITNRKGLLDDLPAPLAGAELGWAVDARRLFIGNGELSEGAPAIGNTEILTEYSNIFAVASAYTYQGAAGGYIVQTGPTAGGPISQTLQSRLDSYAVVTDFGAIGDGVTDCTAAINRALYQLYCREGTPPAARRSLFFPAGVYLITGTILVPAFATLYGEGNNSSILKYQIEQWSDLISWPAGVMVSEAGEFYRSVTQVPTGTSISDTVYWEPQAHPEYVIRTADTLQQTGANIGTNGALPPQSIEMVNMKVTTNLAINGMLIENTSNSRFLNIGIAGPLTKSDLTSPAADTAAIRWASTSSLVCSNVVIDNCGFSGFTWGTSTEQQVKSSLIVNSEFDTLYQGVLLGGETVVNGGASGVKILQNSFDNIYAAGIVIDGVKLNATGFNTFYDVGNEFAGVDYPFTTIVDIRTSDNVSIGDMFQRTAEQAKTSGNPRISINNTVSIAMDGAAGIQLGAYQRSSGLRQTLPNNTPSPSPLFDVDAVTTRAFKFDYTIVRGVYTRTGTVTIVASSDGNGTDLVIDDSGFQNNYTSGVGVSFSANEIDSVVSIRYTTTDGSADAILNYSLTKLA